mgnify:CR=1 FL=1
MKNTAQIIEDLKREVRALKVAFQQSATKINLYTKTLNFSTSENLCTQTQDGYSFSYADQERVVVTLSTSSGTNTLAQLEVSGNYNQAPIVRRIPYSGGARWIVSNAPKLSGLNWSSTTYNFAVQTLVNGTISAKMIWE